MVWVGGQASRVGVRVEAVARVVKRGGETDVPVGGIAEGPVVRELVTPDVVAEGLVVAGLGGEVVIQPALAVRARGWRLLVGQVGNQDPPGAVALDAIVVEGDVLGARQHDASADGGGSREPRAAAG